MKSVAFWIMGMLLATSLEVKADVDPNFHIYICFGQSNMEGNAQWGSQDVGNVDERFQMLATCNFDSPKRTLGNWYKAVCPIVSPQGKLGPTDYFGRTMVAHLPEHKIGVIAVAMGGSPIEMFDKDKYQQKMKENPNESGGHSWPHGTMVATPMAASSRWARKLRKWVSSRASCSIRGAPTVATPNGPTW